MTRYTSDKEFRGRREGRERGWKEGKGEERKGCREKSGKWKDPSKVLGN